MRLLPQDNLRLLHFKCHNCCWCCCFWGCDVHSHNPLLLLLLRMVVRVQRHCWQLVHACTGISIS
jgi:hypothetical protein